MRADFSLHIDFDSTLFDAWRFGTDLWEEVARLSGVSSKRIIDEIAVFHVGQGGRYYDFISHMRSYGLEFDQVEGSIIRLIRQNDYLYPDSVQFIQDLRADGYNPRILSFGEAHVQTVKIRAAIPILLGEANPKQPMPFRVIMRRKNEHIIDKYPGQRGALVDDIPDQQLPAGFSEIHIDRRSDLAEPQKKAGGYMVSNLAQAREVIHLLSDKQ